MSKFSEDYLHYLLAQASAAASASFHAELAAEGIPIGEWRVLASLHPDLCLSVGELSKECLSRTASSNRREAKRRVYWRVTAMRRAID